MTTGALVAVSAGIFFACTLAYAAGFRAGWEACRQWHEKRGTP